MGPECAGCHERSPKSAATIQDLKYIKSVAAKLLCFRRTEEDVTFINRQVVFAYPGKKTLEKLCLYFCIY